MRLLVIEVPARGGNVGIERWVQQIRQDAESGERPHRAEIGAMRHHVLERKGFRLAQHRVGCEQEGGSHQSPSVGPPRLRI